MKDPLFIIIDLFCGFGGTTKGFVMARLLEAEIVKVIACVNHDPKAIKSHWLNNPEVKHFEEDIRTLDLTDLKNLVIQNRSKYPDAKLILWASLECTNFSKAKGGQPRNADSRTLADHMDRYVATLDPDYIQIENVVEFMSWGPLDEKGKPLSRKNGQDWMKWRKRLCSYGYVDEWRELNSANFGAYTSRNRLFGVFAKPWLPIAWPEATHAKNPSKLSMHGDLKKWMPVKDVLDFQDEGHSIFSRLKPLSDNTLDRIYAGLIKYIAKGDDSFISKYYSGRPAGKVIPTDGPAGTVTTIDSQSLIQAEFLLKYNSKNGKTGKSIPPSIEAPCPVVSTQGRLGIVQPEFIVQRHNGDPKSKIVDVDGPARTLTTTGGNQELVQPQFLTHYYSSGGQTSDIEAPCPTLTAREGKALVQPEFLTIYNGKSKERSVNEPCPVIATNDRFGLVQPEYLVNYNHSSKTNSIEDPAPTIVTRDKLGLVTPEPFIDKHYGSKSQNQSINDPAGTLMPNDKHRLVTAEPFIMPTAYDNKPKSIDEPAPTLTASRRHHYLINPAWGGNPGSIDEPCCVIVARQDKAPLYFVQVEDGPVSMAIYDNDTDISIKIKKFMAAYGLVDIKMRMLRVTELLQIQGFPADYKMVGNQSDQKKFIGNSVVPHIPKAWAEALGSRIIDYNQKVA